MLVVTRGKKRPLLYATACLVGTGFFSVGPRKRPWSGGSHRLFERSIQRVEERHPLREELLIVCVRELETRDDGTNRGGFRCAETIVFQIQIVNDGCKARDRRIVNVEDRAQRLERAALALMTEFHAEHVERNRAVGYSTPIDREPEPRPGIDESPNEPRGSHAIDAGPGPRHPEPAAITLRGRASRYRCGLLAFAGCVFLELLDKVTAEGRYVSDSNKAGKLYAPKLFAGRPERDGLRQGDFAAAMERLFAAGAIRMATSRNHRRHEVRCIVRTG